MHILHRYPYHYTINLDPPLEDIGKYVSIYYYYYKNKTFLKKKFRVGTKNRLKSITFFVY